jgi:hypothetical protein
MKRIVHPDVEITSIVRNAISGGVQHGVMENDMVIEDDHHDTDDMKDFEAKLISLCIAKVQKSQRIVSTQQMWFQFLEFLSATLSHDVMMDLTEDCMSPI